MQLHLDTIKKEIVEMGFSPQNGKNGIYYKSYDVHNGYTIFVDFISKSIIYDSKENPDGIFISAGERTTCNFSQAENFVVLECVDRLLMKGYTPACIELEKVYPSGHGHSGRLDILVRESDGKPFLMIECKTWGDKFEIEKQNMLKNGGQLFSYYTNDRDAKYLCLYTSRICDTREYRNFIVAVEDSWHGLSGVSEIYGHWNKNFKSNGIFDRDAIPYDVKNKALTYGDLQTLKEEDSGKIYNQIMEILRHNAISDKPNAFNKLLNLFVCKIIDEDKNPDEELLFQWLETDTDESLQLRLNDLYKEGMWRFLEIKVIDYSRKEVDQKLEAIDPATKQWVMEMYTNTRLKKSPNFAFVEVQDERTFSLNAKVVREIVELLQVYKFRYAQRHEFLGSFFELLLNTSMKQEAGQYFTPVPITRFILLALPLQKLVQDRVDARADELLPTVIDYACGSGHFLTEYMSQMQNIIDSGIIDLSHASPADRGQFRAWQGDIKFRWARDTVYGIDMDNRLVKTTKVSAFFNGDGEANIVWANGLDHFTKSETYRDKLKRSSGQDNGQFDILISNPPYSVDSFKSTISHGEESFTLYPYLTDNSSEIECLFVERMKQMLKVGGWAAIILPSSILTNSGIHAKAREILLKYFNFKAIVELGSGTFMETGTNTVVLFLERDQNNRHENISREINQFFDLRQDITIAGVEHAVSVFVSIIYKDLSLTDYLSIFSNTPTDKAKSHELYQDYKKIYGENFVDKAIAKEKDKLLYFLLAYNQRIVLIKSGKGKEEKNFLGYEFSKTRGREGMHWLARGTKLYDENDPLNPEKAGSYIYRSYLNQQMPVASGISDHVSYAKLYELIEYGTNKFDKIINLGKHRNILDSVYPQRLLGDLCEIKIGGTPSRDVEKYFTGENLWVSVSELNGGIITDTKEKISDEGIKHSNVKLVPKGTTLISFKLSLGKTASAGCDLYTNEAIAALIPQNKDVLLDQYLFVLFNEKWIDLDGLKGDNVFGKSLNSEHLKKKVKIPLPPLEIQQKIVDEIGKIEEKIGCAKDDLSDCKKEIVDLIGGVNATKNQSINQVADYNPSKSEIADVMDDTTISFIEMAAVSNDGHIVGAVDRLLGEVRKGSYTYFRENDIIIAKITPCMENGKCALATGLTNGIGMGSSEFHVFRCKDNVLPEYLFAFLNRDVIRKAAAEVMTGASGHRRVPIEFYRQLMIPLPSLGEQKKIVGKIREIEKQIMRLNVQIKMLKEERSMVLKKYL